ncbi:MAG: hypothetical protein LBD08_01780 [Treponema sp.]|nr:hypothetical protein [Treponema sp.]
MRRTIRRRGKHLPIWKTGLSDTANSTAFGWNQTEVTAALDAVDAFLTAHAK